MQADAAWYANNIAVAAAIISAVALVVSFVSAWFSHRQTSAAERQAKAGEETVRLQADAVQSQTQNTSQALNIAARSAQAAEDSARSTRVLAQLAQRPWIVLEPPTASEVQSSDHVGYSIAVGATLRNSGLTPAFDVRATSQLGQWALPVSQWPLEESTAAGIVIGANLPLYVHPTTILVSNEHLQEVSDGLRVLLFFGECVYKDVFGQGHRPRWCLRYKFGSQSFDSFNSEFNNLT
jgi:hypothetical protein